MAEINKNAREYLLEGNNGKGIVLTHGFTSSPSYMSYAAKDLNMLEYSVFVPLLPGHGTAKEDLRNGNEKLWLETVISGIDKLRNRGLKTVYCMGHSLGGVISLLAAEQGACDGVITIAAPVKIYNYGRVKLFSLVGKRSYYTMNKPDGKTDMFRYYKADGKSVGNLLFAMRKAEADLGKITVPAMVIFSKEDRTVKPVSSDIIYNGVNSEKKEILEISGDHHECIVDSRGQYIDEIHKFIVENS